MCTLSQSVDLPTYRKANMVAENTLDLIKLLQCQDALRGTAMQFILSYAVKILYIFEFGQALYGIVLDQPVPSKTDRPGRPLKKQQETRGRSIKENKLAK